MRVTVVVLLILCDFFIYQYNIISRVNASQHQIPVSFCCPEEESYRIGLDDCRNLGISTNRTQHLLTTSLDIKDNKKIFNFTHQLLPCPEGFVGYTTSNFTFHTENGSLEADQHYLGPGEFCFDQIQMDYGSPMEFIARFCLPDPCHKKNCIRKCCPEGSLFNVTARLGICQTSDVEFNVLFRNENEDIVDPLPNLRIGKVPQCFHGWNVYYPEEFHLLPDGRFYENTSNSMRKPLITRTYCVDNFLKDNLTEFKALSCDVASDESDFNETAGIIYASFLFFSSTFLILTFIVYVLLKELRNIHGVTIMSYVASMTSMYIGLGTMILIGNSHDFPLPLCVGFAVLTHFSILATFTWLNTVSFDIWLTFNAMRPRNQRRGQHHQLGATFIFYSLYAWGIPLVIVVVGQILDNLPNVPNYISKPGFGMGSCWFPRRDITAYMVYLYGPMSILIVANIILFLRTALMLYRASQQSSLTLKNNQQAKQRFRVISSLFVLMGVPWIMEFVSFVTKGNSNGNNVSIWIFTDVLNILTGLFIFIIFICKPKVWKLLKSRLPWLERFSSRFSLPDSLQKMKIFQRILKYSKSMDLPSESAPISNDAASNSTATAPEYQRKLSTETNVSYVGNEEIRDDSNGENNQHVKLALSASLSFKSDRTSGSATNKHFNIPEEENNQEMDTNLSSRGKSLKIRNKATRKLGSADSPFTFSDESS